MPDDLDGDGMSSHADPEAYSDQAHAMCSLLIMEWHGILTPEVLSKWWNIGLQTAKKTIKVMMQMGIQNVLAPGE